MAVASGDSETEAEASGDSGEEAETPGDRDQEVAIKVTDLKTQARSGVLGKHLVSDQK